MNRTARQTFYILICGLVLTMIAAVFTINRMEVLFRNLSDITYANKTVAIIRDNLLPEFSVTVKSPVTNIAKQIMGLEQQNQSIEIPQTYQPQKMRYKLSQQQITNLKRSQVLQIISALIGFFIILVIILSAMVTLCFWATKRLSMPLKALSKAAKTFGTNVDAPSLAQTNNQEMNEVVDAFNQMQAQIRKLIHDRTNMLAAISHDLRTPITRLKLRAEYFSDSPQYKEMLIDFNEMESMISSVLLFASEDAYNEPIERFDLEALLDSVCEDMINTGLKVTYKGYGNRLPFKGRINSLKRAFTNIIQNAVKYGEEAKVKLYLHDDSIRIEVTDKGPGIPDYALEKVFQPFYRIEQSRSLKTGGTGLGLAITRDAILAHGGEIELRNIARGGLKTIVTLPNSNKNINT